MSYVYEKLFMSAKFWQRNVRVCHLQKSTKISEVKTLALVTECVITPTRQSEVECAKNALSVLT